MLAHFEGSEIVRFGGISMLGVTSDASGFTRRRLCGSLITAASVGVKRTSSAADKSDSISNTVYDQQT